ncbi:hypothetical protein NUITMVR1_47910 [Raoultella ornithinolytica]|nr:hypothetical protein NUITMVR1_47910 [Raoultella ornithinolytica]CAE6386790.1 Iron-sulfur cluster repair protein YtfE [Raoultella ornithinolytica]CAH3748460.1 Iron-sulfur cluster repair protein YtfE [Raoultella ornithinolytica]
MAFRDQPLGELALTIPRASALFRKYDMDYCCGGKQTPHRARSWTSRRSKPNWPDWRKSR